MKLINRSRLLIFCSDGGASGGGALDNETKPPFQFPLSAYAGEILNRTQHSKPSKNHSTKNLSATIHPPPRNSYTDKTVNKSPNKHLDRQGLFKT